MSALFLKHPSEQDLALFAGGELGPFSRWRIERHVESCRACEKTVADFFHLQEELSPLAELPEVDWNSLAETIERRVAREVPTNTVAPRRVPGWAWQGAVAAACAAALVAVFMPQAQESKSKTEPEMLAAAPQLERSMPLAEVASAPEPVALEKAEARQAPPAATVAAEAVADNFALTTDVAAAPPPPALGFRADSRPAVSAQPRPAVLLASDGRVTVRSVSADGFLTITERYEP